MKITWKKWGSLLLALALVLSLAPPVQAAPAREGNTTQFFSGLGTKESPYIISTKEHLNNVRLYPDSYFKMGADIVFTEEDFGEGGAYYGNGQGWQPIGSKSTPFTGTFDGDGHTITGLRIHIDTPDVVCAGLFGYVKNGTIANLGMENSKIQVVDCRGFVGGVAGHVSGSTIYNCYYTGMISSSTKAGGIAGWLEEKSNVDNCYNAGFVSSSYNTSGIAGEMYHSTVSNCYNVGSITSNGPAGGIAACVGDGAIRNCYNEGVISVTLTDANYSGDVGGIAGHMSNGTISSCYNSGAVHAFADAAVIFDPPAGGIVGEIYSGDVSDCYNAAGVSSSSFAGGTAGYVYGDSTISSCYNLGAITSSENGGGVAGNAYDSIISGCYNAGEVSASSAGGIVCDGYRCTVISCYNSGMVCASFSDEFAGGIAGHIRDGCTISSCYNTGEVSALLYQSNAGGIVGRAEDRDTITNCYYRNNIEAGVACGSGDTTACTWGEMTLQETFQGLDFETVWTMEGSPEYGYPELIGMTTVSPCKANEHATILTGEKTPTCTEPGYTGDVYCTACGIRIEKGQVQEATGHSYGEPVFDWSEDGKSCTVVFTCERDESHVQKLEADITAEITTPAACGVAGETTYTASVTLESREYSDTLTLADIPALAHDPRLENVREASDTQDGYTGDLVCSHCGEVLKKGQTYERIYRVYNPGNGKHHYTADATERDALVAGGWSYEGIAWNAPKEGKPIYRVYHPATGNHLYTMDGDERDFLAANGWNYEGILCYSAGTDGVPLYRVFNPYVTRNPHHYTDSLEECEFLKSNGWIVEGISWYGLSK